MRGSVVGVSKSQRDRPRDAIPPPLADDDTAGMVRSSCVAGRAVAPAVMPVRHRADIRPGASDGRPSDQAWLSREQELRHDIRHELATIMLLASLLESAPDIGPDSQQ